MARSGMWISKVAVKTMAGFPAIPAKRRVVPALAVALTAAGAADPVHAVAGFHAGDDFAAEELKMWVAQAAEQAQSEGETEAGVLQRMEDTMVQWHSILSGQVERLGEAADRVFDSEIAFEEINQTSVRLRLDFDAEDGEGLDVEPKISVKWVLPGAERRFRLVFSSDDETLTDEGDLGDPLTVSEDDRATAALDFSIRSDKRTSASMSVGVRSDPQVYTRARLRRNFSITDNWKSRIINRLTYFSEDGWENDFRWDFDRPLGRPLPDTREFAELAVSKDRRPWLFRSASRIRWFDERESLLGEQRFSFFNRLSNRSAIAYEALAFGCTDPNPVDGTEDCKEYDLRVRYKWVTKYPWLYFELWPVAAFPERNDYDFTAVLRFRMEVWFGRGSRVEGGGPVHLGDWFDDPEIVALH